MGGEGPWRWARTSASPRAARKAPRRKCKGGREGRRRDPGAPGGARRRQDAADAGRMAAAAGRGPRLSWRRPGAGRACVAAVGAAAERARVPAELGFRQPRRVPAAPPPGKVSAWGALRAGRPAGRRGMDRAAASTRPRLPSWGRRPLA